MKVLIIQDNLHHKNKEGIEQILSFLKIEYKYGSLNDIKNYDIIFSPENPIDTSKYPNHKFIFGPHFSVFPNNKIKQINNIHNNSIYIQPSEWVRNLWSKYLIKYNIKTITFPFPVNTEMFKPIKNYEKNKVFIYFKRRKPEELKFLQTFLKNNKIEYKIFDYVKRYRQKEYLKYLQESKYGIILDAHESQGFAIEEALSCDVPLLVWNTKFMSQEYGGNYSNIPCTTIPYWDNRCGEFFYESNDFEIKYNEFINKLDMYKPRQFILETLSNENCSINLINLIKTIIF